MSLEIERLLRGAELVEPGLEAREQRGELVGGDLVKRDEVEGIEEPGAEGGGDG